MYKFVYMYYCYGGIVVENSNQSGKWSLAEAEDTIKVLFLLNRREDGELPKFRFTDLMDMIARQGRNIYPNMLTDALKSLLKKGQITCEKSGREKYYSLVPLNREQRIQLASSMDVTRIQTAKIMGAISDQDEGWSYYGVPFEIKNRLRSRLRAEARDFRERIENIIDDEVNQFLDELKRKAKGRIGKADLEKGLNACEAMLYATDELRNIQSRLLIFQQFVEEFAPKSIGLLENVAKRTVDVPRTLVKNFYGLTDEEYDKTLKEWEQIRANLTRVFEKLTPRDQRRLLERFASLMFVRTSLCAVVHL